jgi:hypothetical protein
MLSAIDKKTTIKKALKWIFSGSSIFFIGTFFFIIVHDALTGASSQSTSEYCTKYGFLASPDCW